MFVFFLSWEAGSLMELLEKLPASLLQPFLLVVLSCLPPAATKLKSATVQLGSISIACVALHLFLSRHANKNCSSLWCSWAVPQKLKWLHFTHSSWCSAVQGADIGRTDLKTFLDVNTLGTGLTTSALHICWGGKVNFCGIHQFRN